MTERVLQSAGFLSRLRGRQFSAAVLRRMEQRRFEE